MIKSKERREFRQMYADTETARIIQDLDRTIEEMRRMTATIRQMLGDMEKDDALIRAVRGKKPHPGWEDVIHSA